MFAVMNFTEQFLYFIWQFRLFDRRNLSCAGGETLEVINPGTLNKHAGPDFSRAALHIDGTLWIGNVEVHLRSSDWYFHHHQNDDAFESVVLHVVYEHDQEVRRRNDTVVPTLVLEGRFPSDLLERYHAMMMEKNAFPCENQIRLVDQIAIESTLSRLIVERFEHKSADVFSRLDLLKGNWDETFYYFMASSLPQQIFAKHKNSQFQVEALIFGQSGLLNTSLIEEYPKALFLEYGFLRKKYSLQMIDGSTWKFLRMRPQNFPTIRLAQFSALIARSSHLFSKVLELENLKDLYTLFEDLPVNAYWKQHYHFNKAAKRVNLQIGAASIQNLIINTICPLLFSYGKYTDNATLTERVFNFLGDLPAEHNTIIGQYVNAGLKLDNAMMTQSLLQLNKYHCNQKKCLNCGIGIKILNR